MEHYAAVFVTGAALLEVRLQLTDIVQFQNSMTHATSLLAAIMSIAIHKLHSSALLSSLCFKQVAFVLQVWMLRTPSCITAQAASLTHFVADQTV